MRILFYINVLGGGGAERVVANLANQFVEDNIEIVLVTSSSISKEYRVSKKVKRIILDQYVKHGRNRIIKNISYISLLRKIIKREKVDVAISFMQEPNFRAILATRGLKTKTIVSVRNDPSKEYPGLVGWLIGKILLPLADGCVFQTQEAREWFPQRLQRKSNIILNEVAESFFNIKNVCPENVVTVGRLTNQKNHMLLIKAFQKIVEKFPNEKLFIYGDGELREFLEKEIVERNLENNVFLKGATKDVEGVLAKAKIFVLPSDYEGMPNALLEAMAARIPCIATDCPCGGPRTVIQSGINGILVPVRDENALIKALMYLLSNQSIAKEFSINAKRTAEKFKPQTVYQEWKEYISNINK